VVLFHLEGHLSAASFLRHPRRWLLSLHSIAASSKASVPTFFASKASQRAGWVQAASRPPARQCHLLQVPIVLPVQSCGHLVLSPQPPADALLCGFPAWDIGVCATKPLVCWPGIVWLRREVLGEGARPC
jgi:hypothetical protein